MSWTSLDDKWDVGSKLLRAAELLRSDAAHAMWVRGITHCNRENTDGRIYGAVLRSKTYHRKPQAVVDALVKVGALLHLGGDEYEFHDFLEWNDSREEVEAKRKRKQENGRRGGQQSGLTRAKQTESKDEAGASSSGSKNEASASQVLGSCFAFGSPGANTSPLHTSPSEISDPGSLSTPPERARAPEASAAAAANPAVEAVTEALRGSGQLRHLARPEFAVRLASHSREYGFTGRASTADVVQAIGEAASKVADLDAAGEHVPSSRLPLLVVGFVKRAGIAPATTHAGSSPRRPQDIRAEYSEAEKREYERREAEQNQAFMAELEAQRAADEAAGIDTTF